MNRVFQETEEAVFKFKTSALIDHLKDDSNSYDADEVKEIMELLSSSKEEVGIIPSSDHYFGFVILDLIDKGEGSVLCKRCAKVYSAGDLAPISVGWGGNPFAPDIKWKGGKRKQPGLVGGRGFKCPQGHELISKITWIT